MNIQCAKIDDISKNKAAQVCSPLIILFSCCYLLCPTSNTNQWPLCLIYGDKASLPQPFSVLHTLFYPHTVIKAKRCWMKRI